ncbi:type IV pilus modification protein PilV [Colwelliaceae bacterium 6471]
MLNPTHKAKQKGLTFIEVLIALVVLVTGILGAVAMQASAKKGSFDAMQRSVASALAQDIIYRMRANDPTALVSYGGTAYGTGIVTSPPDCNGPNTLCNSADMAKSDLYFWEQALMGADVISNGKNAGGLTGAVGCISGTSTTVNGITSNNITVVISWQGRESIADGSIDSDTACGTAGDKRRQIVMTARII